MPQSFLSVLVGLFLLSLGIGGGVVVATNLAPPEPPVCTIDPLLADELAQQTALLARITSIVEAWEGRQQQALESVERRRQRLQQDALRPQQPTGLDGLPTRMEKQ